jgi:hypothetical protein
MRGAGTRRYSPPVASAVHRDEPKRERRFEYMVLSEIRGKKLAERLNELGAEGWEAVLSAHPGLVLKRELTSPASSNATG